MPENSLPREPATLGNRGIRHVSSAVETQPCSDCGSASTVSTIDRSSHQEVFATLFSRRAPRGFSKGSPGVAAPTGSPETAHGNGASSLDDQIADIALQWVALVEKLGPGAMTVSAIWHLADAVADAKLAAPLASGGAGAPAITAIIQPPCCATCQVSLELQLIVNASGALAAPSNGNGSAKPASVHVLLDDLGNRHIRIGNILAPDAVESAENECEQIFSRAEALLTRHGASLEHVVRTWLYLRHMERDYDALNRARCELFDRRALEVFPGSTGIGGGLLEDDRDFALTLYAIVPAGGRSDGMSRRDMHSDTFNGPWEYGSYFARGMRVDMGTGSTLLLSGTAAINGAGETVGGDDFEVQVGRTLENLQGLLRAANADFENAVQVTSYLKNGADRDRFRRCLEASGLLSVPHTIVEAEVCRPDLLVEIELIACI